MVRIDEINRMQHKPPHIAQKFLRRFLRHELAEEVQGDLEEQFYEKLDESSLFWAKLNYWYQVFNYLRPFAIKNLKINHVNPTTMFRHNLIISFRNFKRYKTSFFINLIGLSTGLACALLIFLWVNDEMNVDKFHEKDSRLYQVLENVEQAGDSITRQTTAGPTAEALATEMPEVEYAVTTTSIRILGYTLSVDNNDIKADGMYASADFFKLFSYEIIQGDENQMLSDKSSIVISEDVAMRLFGTTENVLGNIVEFQHEKQYQVSGVFENVPKQSSLQFDFLLPFQAFWDENEWVTSWFNTAPQTYLLLKEGTDIDQFNAKIHNFVRTKTEGKASHRSPFIARYTDRYLYNQYQNGVQAGGRIEYVRLFSVIAVFILLIACINFMNLSTARATRRIKEVGIKKAVGARRGSLVVQYLGESTLMALLSLLVAIVLVVLLLPQFNEITGKQLALHFTVPFVLLLLCIVLVTGLMAGSYPALYLSGFNPAAVLKGKLSNFMGELWARKGLVVFQFTLSIILIVGVWVVYQQIAFVQTQHLGYEKDNIVLFEKEGQLEDGGKLETFLSEVKRIPGVIGASTSEHDMTGHNGGTYGLQWPGKDPDDRTEFERFAVNYDMIEMLDIPMKEGRTFSKDFGADSSKIIFNEAGIEFMGLTDPIGKTIQLWGEDREIIGVTKDFHFESFHEEVKPLFFYLAPQRAWNVMVKITAGREQEALAQLQEVHAELNPGFSLDYRFIDEDYQALYASEQRVSTLSKYFAGLAILISCLGLFGLAAFTAERRLKEIGIRKVLGASDFGIVRLLSGDFTKMVLVAIVIALPVSYFITHKWLENFAYKIDLEWWFFIGAGLLALLIAWFTVGLQTVKAARVNPTECLKDE